MGTARLVASLAGSLAYRRQELIVVGLLAASVLGGFAIDAWHRGAPGLLDRLEAEPTRLQPVAAARHAAPRSPAGAHERIARPAPSTPPLSTPEAPLDLDRATPAELRRLPGIGPRLAARIVARRDELGGRFASFGDFASVPGLGARRADRLRSRVRVPAEAGAPDAGAVGPP